MPTIHLMLLCCLLSTATAVEVGQNLKTLALPLQTGTTTVDAFAGQVVYLDIWATWCGPCQQSMPWMTELQQRHADEGLAVIGVSIDQRDSDLQTFLDRHHPGITIGHDAEATIAKALAVNAMPTSVLIDRQGVVRVVHKGFRAGDVAELETQIQQLLADKGN